MLWSVFEFRYCCESLWHCKYSEKINKNGGMNALSPDFSLPIKLCITCVTQIHFVSSTQQSHIVNVSKFVAFFHSLARSTSFYHILKFSTLILAVHIIHMYSTYLLIAKFNLFMSVSMWCVCIHFVILTGELTASSWIFDEISKDVLCALRKQS